MGLLDLERSVIGATLLTNGKLIDELNLVVADFWEWSHQELWQVLTERFQQNKACDALSLISVLPNRADLIHDCLDACYQTSLATGQAAEIKELANQRRLKEAAELILQTSKPTAETIIELDKVLLQVESNNTTPFRTISDRLDEHLDALTKPNTNATSGLAALDDLLNGFRPGGLYVIGARPGIGKTVVGLQVAWGLARIQNELPSDESAGLVLFHSLEMSERELMNRLLAQATNIGLDELDKGSLSNDNYQKAKQAKRQFQKVLAINDTGGQSIASIRGYARTMGRTMKIRAIVVDYLGLIADANTARSRYEGITYVSGQLKRLAKDLNVPVIALAQLNRESTNRADKRPTMADLRDSGSVEQDADVVILLHRDDQEKDPLRKGTIEFIVCKNRHGATKNFRYVFEGRFARVAIPVPD